MCELRGEGWEAQSSPIHVDGTRDDGAVEVDPGVDETGHIPSRLRIRELFQGEDPGVHGTVAHPLRREERRHHMPCDVEVTAGLLASGYAHQVIVALDSWNLRVIAVVWKRPSPVEGPLRVAVQRVGRVNPRTDRIGHQIERRARVHEVGRDRSPRWVLTGVPERTGTLP